MKSTATSPKKFSLFPDFRPTPRLVRVVDLAGQWAAPIMIVIVTIFAVIYAPAFLSPANLKTIAIQVAVLGVVTIGQTLVLLNRSIDMSVSATPTQGTKERYTFDMDGNDAMHIGGFADSAGDVVAPHVGFDAPLHFGWHQFVDNFMWQSGAYTTIWDVTTFDNDGGTGSNDVVAGAGLGGLVQLKSDDANTECECSATQGKYFGRAIQSIATIHLRVDATTALAGCEVLFGFSDDPMTEGGEHVCFLFDYSDDADQWQTKTVDGTDVSLAAGANPTAGTFQELRIVLETNGTAHFIVDEVWYASITEAIDNDGEMYLFFGVRSEGAAFETIDVGGIWAAWTHN